jgi:cytochrome c
MRLWDLKTMAEVRAHGDHDGQIYAAAFSPDGRIALSGGRFGYLVEWNLADGKPIRTIKAHDAVVWAAKITPDGRFAVSASSDEKVRVWHLETGDRIGTAGADDNEPKPWLASTHPGAVLYKKCARCHSLSVDGHGRSGPHLAGLFGRRAGSVEGYRYSKALTGVDFRWNEDTLFKLFDEGPDKFLPGTKMPVQRVPNREQLSELVDYLKVLTKTPAP